MKLENMLSLLHSYVNLDSANEIKRSVELIIQVQALTAAEREVLLVCCKQGPLFDGDVPSKSGRDSLIDKGLVTKVVVKGEDGFNACTQAGYWASKLVCAGVCEGVK